MDKSKELADLFQSKRTYREFSNEEIPIDVIINCIKVGLRAPSGANMQPWTFCIIQDEIIKSRIRVSAEEIEKEFYDNQSLNNWHDDLKHLNIDISKPFLTDAPYLIVIFYHKTNTDNSTTYYASKSTGLATGMIISALHQVGLVSLTYTPHKMKFLKDVLERPDHEVPYLLLAVGHKGDSYDLPKIEKKKIEETVKIY
ncbi:nitroreductase family protein [Mycoplasmatota bacterium]|nr:nitroreductase family protein [Mycoplasmatota bacterium]